jgi:Winged helix DNA-binding domain
MSGDQPLVLCSVKQASAFRLDRHHLLRRKQLSPASLCSAVAGVQAQVGLAAELAFRVRGAADNRDDIRAALLQSRTLVKTSAMRMTLHIVPANEFSLYIAALKQSRRAWILGLLHRRLKIMPAEVADMNQLAVEALSKGSLTQQELIEIARKKAGKRMRLWLDRAWGPMAFRSALIEGLVCYGPPRGAEATLVRVDQWLQKQPAMEEAAAKQELLRRYLRAYGPATVRDFAKWSGMPAAEAKAVWQSLSDEMQQVSIDGEAAGLLRADVDALADSVPVRGIVRLLPSFDPLLLAHASKDHLVEPRHYKRVYRAQGWISPVVLVDGKISGVWLMERTAARLLIEIKAFSPFSRGVRARIEEEADYLAQFLGGRCEVRFAS